MPKHGTNIRRRADGRWEGRYKVLQSDNSYKYRSVYGKTCGEVKEKLKDITAARQQCIAKNGTEAADQQQPAKTFTAISIKWLDHIKATRKYSTYVKYRSIYERHIRDLIGDVSVQEISYGLVNEKIFRDNSGIQYTQNLKHSVIAVINQILKYASDNYAYSEIQLTNRFVQSKKKKIEIINHTEQALLIRYLHQEMDVSKAGILLCIFTGLRLGEICALKWDDIDFEQMIIHVRRTVQRVAVDGIGRRTMLILTEPKSTFSIREIPISAGTVQILNQIRHEDEYVVGGKTPLEPRTYQNRFKKYLRAVDVKEYNFHALRHTFATNCIDHDMDVKSLSEILGHANIQITLNKYVHPTMDTKRRQLSVLDSVYGQLWGIYSEGMD